MDWAWVLMHFIVIMRVAFKQYIRKMVGTLKFHRLRQPPALDIIVLEELLMQDFAIGYRGMMVRLLN